MKIACLSLAQLYGEFVLGGSQKVLNDIILGLRKNNIQVRVFCPKENFESNDSFIGDVKIEKILSLSGSFPSPFEIPLYDFQELEITLNKIARWADRIYLHGDGWILREQFLDKPIISGIHDLIYQESVSSVFAFNSNKIIIPSEYLLRTIHSSIPEGKYKTKNLSVIPNAISKSTNNSIKTKNNSLILLFPHRPDPRKGINLALKIANEFTKTNLWKNVVLKVPKFNEELDRDKKNSNITSNKYKDEFISNNGELYFHDWIPIEDMNDYYSSGDLTLCPGNFIESFGLVPLESVNNLTPSLCSAVGAFRDLRDIPGLESIPFGFAEDFVSKGLFLLKNKDKLINGKDMIQEKFSYTKMIKSYIEEFTNLDKNSNELEYLTTESGEYYLAPWCFISDQMIYHDYIGWISETKNKISLNDSNKISIDDNIIELCLQKRILIPSIR